ncbi:ATP-dependent DNA helicase pif1 [Linum perenne]
MTSISKNFFFLHGHGGTGKTYLYNCIISQIRSQAKIVLVVASAGIAATLLPDGVTAHSSFKIPLEVDNLSTCMVKKGTEIAELLKEATLIVWDEAPGPNYTPFGGKTVLLGGDFRQTLPVVPNGSREANVNASLPHSYLWKYCTLLQLSVNMHITGQSINNCPIFSGLTFTEWVLAMGNGTLPSTANQSSAVPDWITIQSRFLTQSGDNPIGNLIARVYPSFKESYQSLAYIKARAIVTPTNVVVSEVNNLLVNQLPGASKKYFSSLELKPYVTVMLLRNINPAAGMYNGTRVLLTHLGDYVLRGLIVGRNMEGRQFPIRICYAMTINKSQDQTLDQVGLYLPKPVFSHGQLYVTVSKSSLSRRTTYYDTKSSRHSDKYNTQYCIPRNIRGD